jgi:hypothetical protein
MILVWIVYDSSLDCFALSAAEPFLKVELDSR